MKNVMLIALFSVILSACNGGGGGGGGGGGSTPTTPTPAKCTDEHATNRGQVLPCVCEEDYELNSFGSACIYNPGTPGGGGNGAPTGLYYSQNPWSLLVNVNAFPQGPQGVTNCNSSTPCTYSIFGSVALPSGLSINSSSGVISGIPSTVQVRTVKVRATNSAGSVDTDVTIRILHAPPMGLAINNLAASKLYKVGVTMPTINFSYSSGVGSVTSITLDKPLPAGMTLAETDVANKVWTIMGNPSASKAIETYTATACGPTSPCSSVSFEIGSAVAPSGFSYNISGHPNCVMDGSIPSCTFAALQPFTDIPAVFTGDSLQFEVVSGGESMGTTLFPSGMGVKLGDAAIYTTSYGPLSDTHGKCTLGGPNTCLYTIKAFNALGAVTTQIKIKVNPSSPATGFHYANSPYLMRTLTPFADITPVWDNNRLPSCSGQVGCYSVSPALPNGLSFSPLSGKISGSAFRNAIQGPTNYTITAGASQEFSTQITIEVKERLPVFAYELGGRYMFKKDTAVDGGVSSIIQNEATLCGGNAIPITSFSISPALPTGLSLNAGSYDCGVAPSLQGGTIKGTPTVLSLDTEYTITGCNSGGCSEVKVYIEIPPQVIKVVTGERHACALVREDLITANNGKVMCWGANDQGQLGFTSTEVCTDLNLGAISCSRKGQYVKVASGSPATFSKVVDIAAGKNHTCIIQNSDNNQYNSGKVWCWGDNSNGQLGAGTVGTDAPFPVEASRAAEAGQGTSISASTIAAGGDDTCMGAEYLTYALEDPAEPDPDQTTVAGHVYCTNSSSSRFVRKQDPADNMTGAQIFASSKVAVGKNFACAIHGRIVTDPEGGYDLDYTSRGIKCWGTNARGQLGDSQASGTGVVNNPVFVRFSGSAITGASDLALGASHGCYSSETLTRCWGDNTYGQLGNNQSDTFSAQSVNVIATSGSGSLPKVSAIGAVGNSSYFIVESGLGDLLTSGKWALSGAPYVGTYVMRPTPILQSAGVNFLSLDNEAPRGASSDNFACAAASAGGVMCWGKNNTSQLGNNSSVDSVLPVKVQLQY